ncbi:hypothetical protein [Sporosarcina sp. P17b]|uniref:hypothetical protein n=1 Tax=Sporosarcina sp. P17b TaxID=2048260 RepID=UPI000C172187|nr:hypothetical protein [Sporosarcina sp. P17b]PIC75047.1 hypothetical protein CSV76_00095 [Sporosarcina sp. P17b]
MAGNRVISAVLTLKDRDFSANAKKATSSTKDMERQIKHSKNTVKEFGKNAGKAMKNVAKGAAVGGAAIVAGLGVAFAATKKLTDGFDNVAKTSRKMGVTSDFYQEMDYWAGQNGVSTDNMEKSMKRLNQRVGEARGGNEKYTGALKALGIDMTAVKKGTLSTEDAMSQSITALSKMTNEQDKAALASELFGTKLAQELMPAIQDGSLSMEDAQKNAKELGFVIGEDTLGAAEKFNDTWDNLTRGVQALGKKGVAGMMPFFQTLMEWGINKLPAIQKFVSSGFDTIGSVMTSMKEKGKVALDAIKQAVSDNAPTLENLKGIAVDVGDKIKGAFELAKPAISWLGENGLPLVTDAVVGVLDKATSMYNFVAEKWPLIMPIVVGIATAIGAYKLAVTTVTTAKKLWTLATVGVTAATKLMSAAMAVTPLGWVAIAIGAVVAIGIVLWKNWDTITAKTKELSATLKTKFGEAKEKVVTFATEMKDKVVEKFGSIVQTAKDLPGLIGKGIADYASKALDGMKELGNNLKKSFMEALNMGSPSKDFKQMGIWIVEGLVNGLNADNLLALGKSVFKGFAGGALNTLESIKGFFTGGFSGDASDTINMGGKGLVNQLAKKHNLRITSGFRPGAVTAYGNPSDHATGNAYDIAGSPQGMWQAGLEAQKNPQVKYVIARNMISYGGGPWKPYPYGGHLDHTHISLKGGREQGGRIGSSGRYLVGEAGPEIVDLPANSRVHNNQNSKRMGNGGVTVVIENFNSRGVTTTEMINEFVPMLKLRLANM